MPSVFTHVFVAETLGKTYAKEQMPLRFWILAAVCAVLPDFDIIGFYTGIDYGSVMGHRGFFHSIAFALAVGLLIVPAAFPGVKRFTRKWWSLAAFFSIVIMSHGFLDSITDEGLGVGFFIPFDNTRYLMPWRPVFASPMRVERFFGETGLRILFNEIIWIWIPMFTVYSVVAIYRKMKPRRSG